MTLDNAVGLFQSLKRFKNKNWDFLDRKKFCLKTAASTPAESPALTIAWPSSLKWISFYRYLHLHLHLSYWFCCWGKAWQIEVGRERREARMRHMAWVKNHCFNSKKRHLVIFMVFCFLIYHDLGLMINLFLTTGKESTSQWLTILKYTNTHLQWPVMSKAPNTSCDGNRGNKEQRHEDQEPEMVASLDPVTDQHFEHQQEQVDTHCN